VDDRTSEPEEELVSTEVRSVFGEVLAELMASRGIPATEEKIGELAAASGLDPETFVWRVRGELVEHVGHLEELAVVLGLSVTEGFVLAYAFEERSLPTS
jgi:hypothetical protein